MYRSIAFWAASSKKNAKMSEAYIQEKYVDRVYDAIAEHFDHTRFSRWPKVKTFLNSLEEGSIVYDIGCGNCKYMNQTNSYVLGLDRSAKLLKLSKEKNPDFQLVASDAVNLPLRQSSCDSVISIAVLHHLSSQELRLSALREMVRVLKPQGRGLVYVWYSEQILKNKEKLPPEISSILLEYKEDQDIFVSWHLQDKFSKQNHQFDRVDSKKSFLVKRFYHLFKKGELENLISPLKDVRVTNSYYDKENWCIQFVKEGDCFRSFSL